MNLTKALLDKILETFDALKKKFIQIKETK